MTSGPRTRQELYDRIRQTSKDEVILEEMVRLGFWPRGGQTPFDPADEIRRRGDLAREIASLQTEQSRLGNIEAIRKEMRKRRLQASREKQKATKERHERERVERAAAWKTRKGREILHLGQGVSSGLSSPEAKKTDTARLQAQSLPIFHGAPELAAALGVTVPELRFLAYARAVSRVSHYRRFTIPKKTGGERLISAPMRRLKRAQRWVLDNVLSKVTTHGAARGFLPDISIVDNARPHVGAAAVLNLDLKDFFPTISFGRIRGMFRALGYGEEPATILALLTSEPELEEVELDGIRWFVAVGSRRLPQGAPTSPAITNIVCRRLDRRLSGLAESNGFRYTRYADDLTFSTNETADLGKLLRRIRWILGQEGFLPHEKKTRILRRGRQQSVTGIVVNRTLSVDRATLRRFRALLFQIDKDGPANKSWGRSPDLFASALGYANFVRMVDREKGDKLVIRVKALAAKHGWFPPRRPGGGGPPPGPGKPPPRAPEAPPREEPPPPPPPPAAPEPPPEPPKKKWWKIF